MTDITDTLRTLALLGVLGAFLGAVVWGVVALLIFTHGDK